LFSRLLSKDIKIRIYKTIVLPVALYGHESWYLTLMEEHTRRLRVFEKRLFGRLFGTKRDKAIGGWRKLHNEELHNLYSSPNIIRMIKSRRMGWAEHVAQTGRSGMHIRYWRESQKERDYWEDQDVGGWTILKWIGWDGTDWIDLAQDRDQWTALVKMVMNLQFP
jgi:hypothetical protein